MPFRVAFDLDGVLADMESALVREAQTLFGGTLKHQKKPAKTPAVPSADPSDAAGPTAAADVPPLRTVQLTPRQQRRLWTHVEMIEAFWESLNEIEPGAVARLARIGADRHWEILFLTRRPPTAGQTAQRQSQRWLQAKGFDLPSVYVVNGSRGRIAAALDLDFVVDDTPENCLDVATDSKARVIGVFRNPEQPVPSVLGRLGVHVVRSVDECLNVLCEIEAGLQERPGAIDRVMQMLGLKQPAST